MMDESEFDNLKDDAEFVDEAFTILKTKAKKDEWGYYKVQFKVKNNTGYDFPEYAVIYRLKASDDTTIQSEEYAYIENFEADSTAWTQDVGYDAKKGRVYEAYAYICGTEDGSIYNEVELKESVTIKIKE